MIRKVVLVVVFLTFLLSIAFSSIDTTVSFNTTLYVNPQTIIAAVNHTLTINVNIANVGLFAGFMFKLRWNGTILDLMKTELFMPWQPYFIVRNETGPNYWEIQASKLAGAVHFNGNATLARLTYEATAPGNSTLDLYDTRLADRYANPIPHDVFDGYIKVCKLIGDVNFDGLVDMKDITILKVAFGSEIGDPNWNPNVDLISDSIIDIFDGVVIAANFGKP